MIMKSNYQSTPCDNTVNTVQYWLSNWALQLTRFFLYFTTNLQRKPNRRFFSKPNQNRTELKKSIPHIPGFVSLCLSLCVCSKVRGRHSVLGCLPECFWCWWSLPTLQVSLSVLSVVFLLMWLSGVCVVSVVGCTGWRKKSWPVGHPISLQIFWKLHDRIPWKLVNFCKIICWTQSLTFCLKIHRTVAPPSENTATVWCSNLFVQCE